MSWQITQKMRKDSIELNSELVGKLKLQQQKEFLRKYWKSRTQSAPTRIDSAGSVSVV